MVRGIERRIVELKLSDNKFYERACLILKVDTGIGIPNERELIDEARRIVSEIGISKRSDKRRAVRNSIFALLCFCIGLITGICAAFLIK